MIKDMSAITPEYFKYRLEQETEQYKQEIERLNKENKILRKNAEHNDKVVDKVNWENKRLNNIINELEKDIKNLYTYGIKNNAEQRDYLLNRLEELKEHKGSVRSEYK